MDFDDLLYYTNVLLRDNADVLDFYRNYFTYILVDEYQDTNFAQHVIVRQLCQGRNNLCVVGDDAQSIYSSVAQTSAISSTYKRLSPTCVLSSSKKTTARLAILSARQTR